MNYKSIVIISILLCGLLVSTASATVYLSEYAANNVLNLHMNGTDGSTTFTDKTGKTVTPYGDVKLNISTRFLGSASAKFDGTGDALNVSDSDEFAFGTENWTIKTDVVFNNPSSSFSEIYNQASDGFNVFNIFIHGSTKRVLLYVRNSTGAYCYYASTSGLDFQPNTWYQIVWQRYGSTIKLYVNGNDIPLTATNAITKSTSFENISAPVTIGYDAINVRNLDGYIDEVEVWKGGVQPPISILYPQYFESNLEKTPIFYFGYGDSITSRNDTYVIQMRNRYNITASARYIPNGAGLSSWEGITNHTVHPGSPYPTNYFIMLGINDRYWNASYTGEETADNLIEIYDLVRTNGSTPYILLEGIRYNGAGTDADQQDNTTRIQNRLSSRGYAYIKAYDAYDSIPGNGQLDSYNLTTTTDGTHPNALGSSLIADYVWESIQHELVADFTASNTSGFQPLLVQFADTSTTTDATIDAWNWSFGDGNVSSSQNPTHTYEVPGTYQANLTITNTSYSLVSTKLTTITVFNPPPVADFTISNLSGIPPLVVRFTDTSSGSNITKWDWNFGEGNTSTLQNPLHIFESLGEYQVNLTVTNDGGSSTKLQNITVAMFGAHFIANKTLGAIPLSVSFTDTSIGNYDTWNWSVDDGTLHWFNKTVYADRNLEYTFNNIGSWRVNLSVQNISESGPIYSTSMNITATNVPPVASFTGYPSAGTTSTPFVFNSTSTGIITSYNWSFGDGNYSTTQNTTHVFPSNGVYNVNLTVNNDGGSSYVVHSFTVSSFSVSTSISPTSGVIPLLVIFGETTSGLIPDSYYWEFGDGATSTDKNTTHTYTTIGVFNVNHRVVNDSTVLWSNTTNAVTALGGSVTANFTANVTAGNYPLDVQFTDTSEYVNTTPSSWYWVFGDGFTSTLQNPSHTYSNAGSYSVNFTTNTDYGSSYKLRSNYINVGGVAANGRQDVILVNSHNITLYVKDANSGNLISYATITDETGKELTSYGNGVFTGYYSTGQHTFVANASNYYQNRATYLVSSNLIQTIYLTQVATSVSTTWYTPKTIQIGFTDAYGNQLKGASVNAHYNETTLPNGVSDLISNYGMNANVANEALNGTLMMSGSTDYQGNIVFTMLSTIKYDVAVTYGGNTNYYSIYPQDSQYQFKFITVVSTDNIWDDLYANGNTKVWATEPDPSNVTFWWSFQDMTSLTTRIDFYLKDTDSGTMVYITNVTTPVAGSIYQLNYTVPNVRGKNYMAWENYTRVI